MMTSCVASLRQVIGLPPEQVIDLTETGDRFAAGTGDRFHRNAHEYATACKNEPEKNAMLNPETGNRPPGEYERRATEFDRFRIDTLREPEHFADTAANDEETLRLGHGNDLTQVGPKSVTVMLRLSASLCRLARSANSRRVPRRHTGAGTERTPAGDPRSLRSGSRLA